MKKIGLVIAITIILLACDFGPRQSNANSNKIKIGGGSTAYTVNKIDGVEYHVYTTGSYDGGIHVINHTKEKLITEGLQQQILVD